MNKRQAHHAAVFVLWLVMALVLLYPLAAHADCTVTSENTGSMRYYLEIEGEPIPNESGNPLYFLNPVNAANWAAQISANTGDTVDVVRGEQVTRITMVCDVDPVEILPGEKAAIEYNAGEKWLSLDGATLAREATEIRYTGTGSMIAYCCKIGAEPHRPALTGNLINLDFAAFPADDGGQRELYYDIRSQDGGTHQNNLAHFALEPADDKPPVDPPVDPPVFEGRTVTLTWTIPNEREDGTAMPVSELCCYRIEYGLAEIEPDHQIDIAPGTAETADIEIETPGVWRFRVSAIDTTPSGECTEDAPAYSCGGPLMSDPSDWVSVDLTRTVF